MGAHNQAGTDPELRHRGAWNFMFPTFILFGCDEGQIEEYKIRDLEHH